MNRRLQIRRLGFVNRLLSKGKAAARAYSAMGKRIAVIGEFWHDHEGAQLILLQALDPPASQQQNTFSLILHILQ